MEEKRIRIAAKIPGDDRGLKTFIAHFLADLYISGDLQRVPGGDGKFYTLVEMEAAETLVHRGKVQLMEALKEKFPNIATPFEWNAVEPIGGARPSSRQNSSGNVLNQTIPYQGIMSASGVSPRTLSLIKHFAHVIQLVSNSAQKGVVSSMTVCYIENRTVDKREFNISKYPSFEDLLRDVVKKFNIPFSLTRLYLKKADGTYSMVDDINLLTAGEEYYVNPPQQAASSFKNMEEFYEALRANGLDDEDMAIVEDAFKRERINVNVLHRLTDEKLKLCGLKQLGLRKVILSVLAK